MRGFDAIHSAIHGAFRRDEDNILASGGTRQKQRLVGEKAFLAVDLRERIDHKSTEISGDIVVRQQCFRPIVFSVHSPRSHRALAMRFDLMSRFLGITQKSAIGVGVARGIQKLTR